MRRKPHGLDLRVDGTLASSYRPGRSAGPVWDALAAPLLAVPEARRRRVLILGLGGGSAARVARALAPGALIVGVERNADVLQAARRHFELDALRIELVVGDALEYLEGESRQFDAVIEDLFLGSVKSVRKPDWLPRPGFDLAARRLARGGVLSSNTIHETPAVLRAFRRLFGTVLSIGVKGHYNHILAGGPGGLAAPALRRRCAAHPLLAPSLSVLSFRTLQA